MVNIGHGIDGGISKLFWKKERHCDALGRGGGGGGLCLTFCDRQTTLFGTFLYDTFCVDNCVTFGGVKT